MTFALTRKVTMSHHQILYIPHSGRKIVTAAISLYVLRDDLFHVETKKPFRPLFVGAGDLLIELGSDKLAWSVLSRTACRKLQLCQVFAGNHQIVV